MVNPILKIKMVLFSLPCGNSQKGLLFHKVNIQYKISNYKVMILAQHTKAIRLFYRYFKIIVSVLLYLMKANFSTFSG